MRGGATKMEHFSPASVEGMGPYNPPPASKPMKGGSRRRRRQRGGNVNFALSPTDYDGRGVQTSGNAVQFAAGMGN